MTGALHGSPTPRIESVPPWVSSVGGEAVELAAVAGLLLDPWQCRILDGGFGQKPNRQWSAREVGLIAGRQSGKSVVVKAAMLAGAFLLHEEIVYTAHLMSTTRKIRAQVQQLIESTPDLDREVRQIRTGNEEMSITLRNDGRIDFAARTESSARGWTGDRVMFDEGFALTSEQIGALMPIILARPHWQLWYVSMAGMAKSHALRRVRRRALDGDPDLAYYEWSADEERYHADPDVAALDEELWAQANPALGIRITRESIVLLQRSMDPAEFAREILCVWDDPRGVPLIDPLVWDQLADPTSTIVGGMVFALEAAPDLVAGAIGVAGYRADQIAHVEITGDGEGVLDHRPGVEWMIPRAVELRRQWPAFAVVLDPSGPTGALLNDLRKAGIEPELVSGREWVQACGAFRKDAIATSGDKLRHLGQRVIADAIKVAKRRDAGDGGWTFGRRASEEDITALNAVVLARHGLAVYGELNYNVLESVF